MILQKLNFVDIDKDDDEYLYTYVVFATKFLFLSKYIKILFKSESPHYLWNLDIQPALSSRNMYFEDLNPNSEYDIGIGVIKWSYFNEEDIQKYKKDILIWKDYSKNAVSKQMELKKEYENEGNIVPELGQF